jgi:hypothetical protein
MTQIEAPMFITVDEDRSRIPAKSEVIWIIRKTAKVIPTRSAANFALSFTSNLNASRSNPFKTPPADPEIKMAAGRIQNGCQNSGSDLAHFNYSSAQGANFAWRRPALGTTS